MPNLQHRRSPFMAQALPNDTRPQKTALLALAALGVVFGDIGTSPLYALKECFHASHGLDVTEANVLGILSLIFWTITVIVSLKYIAFIMRADNNGEGGIMALLALTLRAEAKSGRRQLSLVVIGLFGAALFFGDGIITPAISVMSAVEGLSLAAPGFDPYIVPITLLVLVLLFSIQRVGTGAVGTFFGPIMLLWFVTLGVLGIIKVVEYPETMAAINPLYAVAFILENQFAAFIAMGAVVLTVTGGEALYADMGHFGRRPIRLTWFIVVLPALFFNYCGQGAMLLHDPEAISNPFFHLVPRPFLYPVIALSTLATVIASQSVISGVFSVTRQAVQLGYLPRLHIQHTSSRQIGQIYIPSVNWVLLAAIVVLVLAFQTSSALASAYGIAVTMTMMCDTLLAIVVAYRLWRWHPALVFIVALPFLLLDFTLFGATSLKILQGGWFSLLIGVLLFTVMFTWKSGRQILHDLLRGQTLPMDMFIDSIRFDDGSMKVVSGTAVFMVARHDTVPHALLHNIKHNKVIHQRNVLLTLITRDVPFVKDEDRLEIESKSEHFHLITGYYGFKEQPDVPALLELCESWGIHFEMMDTSFFLSRETLVSTSKSGMAGWREKLFVAMTRNANTATDFFQLPTNRVVELGAQVEL
ncbi:probable potassium transport system protein kup [gamma proteobacterium HdN1]|nr:probable potassium transport system protein kup [gamma proteobacterium HdN1]